MSILLPKPDPMYTVGADEDVWEYTTDLTDDEILDDLMDLTQAHEDNLSHIEVHFCE